jgi:hypothetical protein
LYGRVDLDGINVAGLVLEGNGDVVAGPRADDQDVLVGPAREPVIDLVVRILLRLALPDAWCGMPSMARLVAVWPLAS